MESRLNEEQPLSTPCMLNNRSITEAFALERIIRGGFFKKKDFYGSFDIYIEKYVDKEVREKLVELLSKCKCCDRHQVNRPVKYEPWVETRFHNQQHTDCECRCRNFSRWLCRTCE